MQPRRRAAEEALAQAAALPAPQCVMLQASVTSAHEEGAAYVEKQKVEAAVEGARPNMAAAALVAAAQQAPGQLLVVALGGCGCLGRGIV